MRARGWRRAGRAAVAVLAALFALVVLLCVLVLLPPVRDMALRKTIHALAGRLPGEMSARSAWPGPGRVVFSDVLWTAEGDTVCAARTMEVRVGLTALLHSDVHVKRLVLEGAYVDLPAFGKLTFPPRDTTAVKAPRTSRRFPRPGALARVPSVGVDSLWVGVERLRLSPDGPVLSGEIGLSLDLLQGHPPRVVIHSVHVEGAEAWWTEGSDIVLGGARPGTEGGARFGLASLPTLRLAVRGEAKGLRLVVHLDGQATPPEGAGVDLLVEPRMVGNEVQALVLTGLVTTPRGGELAAWPLFAEKGTRVPDLPPLTLDLSGELRLGTSLEADLAVDARPNAWLRGGTVRARYTGERTSVDSLRVDLAGGCALWARGSTTSRELHAHVEADVSGIEWLASLGVPPPPIEGGAARLAVDLTGEPRNPALRASLGARGIVSGTAVDTVRLTARSEGLGERPVEWDLLARGMGVEASLQGRLETGEAMEVALSPLWVREVSRESARPEARWGRVRRDADGSLTLESVRVVGDLGALVLDGFLKRDGRMEMTMAGEWPEPPVRVEALLRLQDPHAFREAWRKDGPYRIQAQVAAASIRDRRGLHVEADAFLPGPRQFSVLLPDSARVEDLGPISAHVKFDEGAFGLDLSETPWLPGARAHGSFAGGSAVLDSLALAAEDLGIRLSGTAGDTLDLAGSVSVGPAFLGRFASVGTPRGTLEITARGPRRAPQLQVVLDGAYENGTTSVPRIMGTLALSLDAVTARLAAPQGIRSGGLVVDSLTVSVASEADTLFPARLDVAAAGPDASVALGAVVDRRGREWEVRAERLSALVYGRTLEAERPFTLRGDTASVALADLDLAGSLGTVTGEGSWSRDNVTAAVNADLRVPDPPSRVKVLPGLWPDRAEIRVEVRSARDADVTARVTGLVLGTRTGTTAEVSAHLEQGAVRAGTAVFDGSGDMVRGRLALPLTVDLGTMAWTWGEAPVEGSVDITALPLPTWDKDKKKASQLDGRLAFHGTPEAPSVDGALRVSWPGRKELADHVLEVDLDLKPSGEGRAQVETRAALRRAGRAIVNAELRAPLLVMPDSLRAGLDPERPLYASLRTDTLSLGTYGALLPRGMAMKGKLRMSAQAEGPRGEVEVSGDVRAWNVSLSEPGGSKLTFNAALDLGGTQTRPSVKGSIDVVSGVIVIPETPEDLHPVSGNAALWQLRAAADSSGKAAASKGPPEVPPMDLDVTLRVPATLFIKSREMYLGLAGNLTVKQSGTVPVVVGELKATTGRITVLGREFNVQEGRVTFYGGDERDPTIDVTVGTRIDDVDIRVTVTGTALKPELAMESTPDMEESDIMSLIVFGRKTDDLSDSQMDLLGERAGQMATAYVSAGLSQTVGKKLGLDHMALEQGNGDDEGTTLTVGKYLNPRTLMTYQQALEGGEQFVVGLRYLLTQYLGVSTTYDSGGNSALKLSLETEY